ncbi:protein-L-isoaspartate O-methyltransferase [Haloglomus irregulare]|jgi:protein-L-isoaspartate(D-aspartate) O-methyltransferase|uniref:protein-L-isoaspartate(D-aspartate) O-methyltransferase n=1 Tax=Haloglomus irregulare TaxID=2234134 RepID=A0A554NGD8_9EURY|nr:protein-L-isoaspartate O-methyltransferase [Haloglomus irregulare]TSD16060.1 protein-L-isoaspartate O-methyltransferase [Haloglomus irregulare]
MDPAVLRDDMVDSLEHEAKRCVRSEAVSVAMRAVPREAFVDDERAAYADRAFERHGTRVLAPSTAARLLEALVPEPGDEVLVVGAGVGYTAAVCAELAGARHVHAVDIDRRLVYDARSNLAEAGYGEVLVDCRDGADGLPEYAPYDRVLVEAAAIEPPRRLVRQLADDGRLVLPLGGGEQTLTVVEPTATRGYETVGRRGTTAFAPMLVEGEQATTVERNRTVREDREHAERAAERRKGWEQEWIDWDREL